MILALDGHVVIILTLIVWMLIAQVNVLVMHILMHAKIVLMEKMKMMIV